MRIRKTGVNLSVLDPYLIYTDPNTNPESPCFKTAKLLNNSGLEKNRTWLLTFEIPPTLDSILFRHQPKKIYLRL